MILSIIFFYLLWIFPVKRLFFYSKYPSNSIDNKWLIGVACGHQNYTFPALSGQETGEMMVTDRKVQAWLNGIS